MKRKGVRHEWPVLAYCLKVAAEAPEPTPAQIDRIGRLFATAAERIEARQRAGEQGPALDQAA
jgi:hypothetical protein